MSEYKLKTPKKVEEAVVGTYQKIEHGVVGAYKKIEHKFVDTFLEQVEPPVDGAPEHENESPM